MAEPGVAPLARELLMRATGDEVGLHATLVALQAALAGSAGDALSESHGCVPPHARAGGSA
jgi:hypothetical protein